MRPVIDVDLEVTLIRKVSLLLIWSSITRLQIMGSPFMFIWSNDNSAFQQNSIYEVYAEKLLFY